MKIGIFTLHSTTNYGGALQTYALSQILKEMGHDPEIVCYCNDETISWTRKIIGIITTYSFRNLFFLIKEFANRIIKQNNNNYIDQRQEIFNNFYRKKLVYTERIWTKQLPKFVMKYDVLITGSDQVWTDLYTNNLIYFFDKLDMFKGKRISYAACSAHEKAPIYNRAVLKTLLTKFNAISVRDNTTAKLVKNVSGLNSVIVGDPTILYDFGDFSNTFVMDEPYIFCYFLGKEPTMGHYNVLKKIKTVYGNIKVVVIAYPGSKILEYADVIIDRASPLEWVGFIAQSAFVYTDSFHSVLFSLKYHKPFMAYYGEIIRASRFLSLRKEYSLENRITNKLEQVDLEKEIKWDFIDSKLNEIRIFSLNFLRSALSTM